MGWGIVLRVVSSSGRATVPGFADIDHDRFLRRPDLRELQQSHSCSILSIFWADRDRAGLQANGSDMFDVYALGSRF